MLRVGNVLMPSEDPEAIFNFDAGPDPTLCTVYLSGQSIKI
jgi:hypothetical protein